MFAVFRAIGLGFLGYASPRVAIAMGIPIDRWIIDCASWLTATKDVVTSEQALWGLGAILAIIGLTAELWFPLLFKKTTSAKRKRGNKLLLPIFSTVVFGLAFVGSLFWLYRALSAPNPETTTKVAQAQSALPLRSSDPTPPPREFANWTPRQLLALYEGRTQIQADALIDRFKGKWIETQGTVFSVFPDGSGRAIALIMTDNDPVECRFDVEPTRQVSQYAKGDFLRLRGSISSTQDGAKLSLQNCEVIPQTEQERRLKRIRNKFDELVRDVFAFKAEEKRKEPPWSHSLSADGDKARNERAGFHASQTAEFASQFSARFFDLFGEMRAAGAKPSETDNSIWIYSTFPESNLARVGDEISRLEKSSEAK